ncbi:MAG: Gfo/Idh/MocA family oxidoreductase [Christensenellaceae bacterium]
MKSMNAVLIGFGYWGPNIARNLNKSKDFNLYGICEIDPKKIEKARDIYGDSIRYFTDYKEVIADKSIEMCAVALRNEIGQTVAREVLKAKKHLFMEKPMATRMEDALLLKKLAEENNVLIHVDHILVYNPFIKRIKEIIKSGELGDIIYFESARANLGPHMKNDMNAMWDLAVHDLAIVDFLCEGKQVKDVQCMGIKKYGSQEALTYLTMRYDEFVAMIKSSWISPVKERRMIIGGTKKMIVFDDLSESEKILVYDKGFDFDKDMFSEYGKYEAKVRMGDLFAPYIENEDSLLNSVTHFAECIKANRQSASGPDQAIRVLDILEKADASLRQGECK